MDLSERLAELTRMKANGMLSEQEFEALTELAKDQSVGNSSTSSDEMVRRPSKPIYLQAKFLAGSAVVVAALVLFFLMQSRSTNPLESKEYQELLDMKTELIAKQAELEAELSSTPDSAEYVVKIASEVRRLQDAIAMINESGL
jgi:cytochrome c-type biogenesis protein CcmH/NrfG